MIATHKPIKPLNPRSADVKYTGHEPEWHIQPDPDRRMGKIIAAFSWYNYHYDKKMVKELVIDWLIRNDRQSEAKEFGRVPESIVANQVGWLTRMNLMGLELSEHEELVVNNAISQVIHANKSVKEVIKEAEVVTNRPTIQDRLREKMSEAAGELEGLFDDFIVAGAKMSADYKPMFLLRSMNVAPQMVSEIVDRWKRRLAEIEEAIQGKDAQLVEAYSNFNKIQMRNIVKFCELVIADCGSYVQIKKVERKPRKKKPVSPEKLTARFKYMKEFTELKLKSAPVTSLVNAQEAWLYDTKKRKLIHVTSDVHIGTFTVKGGALIGFDTNNSTQKTLRKPAEQLKAIMAGGAPQSRKVFKEIKATETKFNGRGNENLILLKVR